MDPSCRRLDCVRKVLKYELKEDRRLGGQRNKTNKHYEERLDHVSESREKKEKRKQGILKGSKKKEECQPSSTTTSEGTALDLLRFGEGVPCSP